MGIEGLCEKTLSAWKLRDHFPYRENLTDVGKGNMAWLEDASGGLVMKKLAIPAIP